MELFPTCGHGRDAADCLFCKRKPAPPLARSTDPATSKAAAESLSFGLRYSHRWMLDWLREQGPATDDAIALAAVDAGLFERTEAARRQVRTLREKHGLLEPAVDKQTGFQITFANASGRQALGWQVKE